MDIARQQDFPVGTAALWRAAIALMAITLGLFGFAYSLLSAGIDGALFPYHANGSIIIRDGKAVASELVAQPFAAPGYFQPRPSAAKYDPMSAAGSNLARTNPDLRKRVEALRGEIARRDGIAVAQVADDLLTQSGSGVDPDISVQAAMQQVARVARARGLPEAEVRHLVEAGTAQPQFGIFGPARVNVVRLNLALDARR
ncbi:MAG: potassium-transporting ATPase subunit KdpC [Proteobacteria bacterium]|nr:potassium-transporting ATPase subunit KdpC [Pseudomonadota bacterium]